MEAGDMEQRQLPVVIFIMIFFLLLSLAINEIDYGSFSIPQVLSSFRVWLQWKSMPGW